MLRRKAKDTKASPLHKQNNQSLMADIKPRFKKDHSPEQIAGRLKLENPEDKEKHVSTETIYKYLYNSLQQELELRNHFRQGQKKRHKRLPGKDKRGCIPNRKFIGERPLIVESKSRLGDWEGDTIEGAGKKGYIATFVDRKTKFLKAYLLPTKETLGLVNDAKKTFRNMTVGSVKMLTVNNGKEFAAHGKLADAIKGDVVFARPYYSWERGLNEHTNGLLRQYFPKKMPLSVLTKSELDKAVKRINNRPRKSLDYQTPQEAYTKEIVALQT